MAKSDRDKEQAIVQWLRAHEPQEWWLWQQAPDKLRVRTGIQLPWPYVLPDPDDKDVWPGWGLIIFQRALNMKRAGDVMTDVRGELVRRLRIGASSSYVGEAGAEPRMLGRMLVVKFEFAGRGGPYRYVWTPPMYKFCDLDKLAPAWARVRPFDYWIQPQVYAETGQIMQGSPVWNAYDPAATNDGTRSEWNAMRIGDYLAGARPEDGSEALEAMHVALDSWIERYERTGETTPKKEFAWTFAEERDRAKQAFESRCEYGGRYSNINCKNKPAFFARLPTMQGAIRVCRDHVPIDEDYTVTPIPEGE